MAAAAATPYEALARDGGGTDAEQENSDREMEDEEEVHETPEETEEERRVRMVKEDQERGAKWASFGWKINPHEMFQMSFGNLQVVLDRIGDAIADHEKQIHNPPWLEGINEKLKQMDAMAGEITELREENEALRAEIEEIKVDLEVEDDDEDDDNIADSGGDGGDRSQDDFGLGDLDDSVDHGGGRRGSGVRGGENARSGLGGENDSTMARKTAKELKQLKADLAGLASQLDHSKADIQKENQRASMEAVSKFSHFAMDLERLKRHMSTVASSADWKNSQEQHASDVAELKRTMAMMTEETKRFLDMKMGDDLALSQRWREEVEKSFKAQLKLMDDRVAIIQDDVYQIRTGHGLELNELEDRFEEHLKTSEKTFGHVQADLKRLLKRSNDANDRLNASDVQHAKHVETFENVQQHAAEIDERHAELKATHGSLLDNLRNEMDARVEEHEQTQEKFGEHDEQFAMLQRQLQDDIGATLIEHARRHDKHDTEEEKTTAALAKLDNETLPGITDDISKLNEDLKKMGEQTNKTLNKFRTALEKTNTHITNTQKEVRAFDERITANEEKGTSLTSECKALRESLDEGMESVRAEILEVDKRCDEIDVIRNDLAQKSEMLAECQNTLHEHAAGLEQARQNHQDMMKRADNMVSEFDSKLEQAERRIGDDVASNATSIAELKKEGEHRDRAIFNLASKVDENERIAEMHRQPEAEMRMWMEELVKLDIEFEQEVVPEKVPMLNTVQAKLMARRAQDLAGYFAMQADFEVINQYVGAADAEELKFDESTVDMLRHTMTEDFLVQLVGEVQAANARPTKVMLEARAKFKNKLRRAIESALTKHEQVEIAGNSRLLGRSLKPTCVACDRPLHTRRRVKDGPSQHTGPRPATSHGGSGSSGGSSVGKGGNQYRGDIPKRSGGHPGEYLGGEARPIAPIGGTEYVYRGGFRMPKTAPEADVFEIADGGLPSGSRVAGNALPALGPGGNSSTNQVPEQLMSRTVPAL